MNKVLYYVTVFFKHCNFIPCEHKKRTEKHTYCPECGKNREDY